MTFLTIAFCAVCALAGFGLFWAYRRGLKDGLKLAKADAPAQVIEPVQPLEILRQAVTKTENDVEKLISDGLMNIIGYDVSQMNLDKK
jgi:hypothetical protein